MGMSALETPKMHHGAKDSAAMVPNFHGARPHGTDPGIDSPGKKEKCTIAASWGAVCPGVFGETLFLESGFVCWQNSSGKNIFMTVQDAGCIFTRENVSSEVV